MVETVRFPDLPLYHAWGAPLRAETQAIDLEVIEGQIPVELDGAWYRAGPDRQYPPMLGDDIFVDGEGMVHRIRFENGRVDYLSRWVRTTRFALQAKARRSLFGRYRNRYTNDPSVEGVSMGTANTTPIWHAGKLLVFKEDDLPWELDPETLETRGRYDYGGQITSLTLSAHPKHDQRRDELLTFSYMAKGDASLDVVFYAITADGNVVGEIPFQGPWAAMMHDWAVTENFAVFFFGPLITDLAAVRRGGSFYQYHPAHEVKVAVLPRKGSSADIRWFRVPHFTTSHTLNAFEADGAIHVDLCHYDGNAFPFFPTSSGAFHAGAPPMLKRMSFDLTRNEAGCEQVLLSPVPGELPQIDERFHGLRHRHAWRVAPSTPDGEGSVTGPAMLIRDDLDTGGSEIWNPGPGFGLHEAQFVPRRPNSPEGDGFVLVLLNRLQDNRTDIIVLDALKLAAGPVARVKMPVRVRMTFHGCWAPAETLTTGRYPFYHPSPDGASHE